MRRRKITDNLKWEILGNIIMILLSLSAVIPFILLFVSSLTSENAALNYGYQFWPKEWSLEAYRYLLKMWKSIGHAYFITIIITVIGTVFGLTVISTFSYALSRKKLPGRSILLFLITFTMLFNGGACATYIIYSQVFHIKNTIFGLIVPGLLMNGFYIMMFRNYFENSIPEALMEAAHIDGASEFKMFIKIVVPLSLPMFATIGLTLALGYWNDWTNAMYYVSADHPELLSIQAYLNNVNENIKFLASNNLGQRIDTSALPSTTIRMAIGVVGVLPILCIYPFFQKWFVRGITAGAVKE